MKSWHINGEMHPAPPIISPAPPVVHGWSRTFMSVVIVVENMSDASTYVGECFLYQDVHSDTPDPDSGFPQVGGLVPGYRAWPR